MSNEKTPNEEKRDESTDTEPKAKKPAVRSKRLTTGLRGGLPGDSTGDGGGDTQVDGGSSTCYWSCRPK